MVNIMKAEELINERNRILDRLVQYFKQTEGVRGIFIAGSIPANRSDEWSDIDARIVISPKDYKKILSERLQHPKNWGNLFFNNWHLNTIHCVSHFRPFIKVDVFYYSVDSFFPTPWLTLPIHVHFDPDGVIAKTIAKSKGMEFVPTPDDVNRHISMSIATAHEIFRRVHRGELFYAEDLLNYFRKSMIEEVNFVRKRPFENIERNGTPDLKTALATSYVPLDKTKILEALRNLLPAYEKNFQW